MQITKLGHCCLLLEVEGTRILTDPGYFTTVQDTLADIDVLIITHEHQDHFHVPSVAAILQNNPIIEIVCNKAVAALIQKDHNDAKITVVEDGESAQVHGILIEGFGHEHAKIYGDMGAVENTGYMVAGTFYFPGDNFHVPGKPVDILALPVAAPWLKISETVEFAKLIKARIAFGVHDGMILQSFRPFFERIMNTFLSETKYITLVEGESQTF